MKTGPATPYDFRRFWDLVAKVTANIRIGVISEQAKAEAAELFHRAEQELAYVNRPR
jgi:hypothetical protein